jgi:hypothetical protein
MKQTVSVAFLILTITIGFVFISLCSLGVADNSARCKVSGHIVDSNGAGIGGAMVIFNVPDTVPAVYSNLTGYYEILAPAGIYHMNVWPPFDSNYMSYDLVQLAVSSDMVKNVTLRSEYKVSGYVTFSNGQPIPKGVVFLSQTAFSGWFTTSDGYYFLSAPVGTYTLTVKPANQGNTFPIYTEYNVVISGTTAKNIVLPSPVISPTPTSPPIQTEVPTPTSSPAPTPPSPKLTPTLSLTCKSKPTSSEFEVEIAGSLTYHGVGISGVVVFVFYSADKGTTWYDLTQLETDANGVYSVLWFPQLGGNYLMKTVFEENDVYNSAITEANLAVVSVTQESVFSVTSNSTLSALAFDSTTMELSFTVSGPTGTAGYVNVNIPKSLVNDITNLKVLIDNNEINFIAEEGDSVWLMSFTYHHSTHLVNIALSPFIAQLNQISNEIPKITESPQATQSPQTTQSPQEQPTQEPTQTPKAFDPYMVVAAALAVVVVVLASALVFKRKAKPS